MYHLDTPELIAKHIECLKRNTKQNLPLISSLAEKLIESDSDIMARFIFQDEEDDALTDKVLKMICDQTQKTFMQELENKAVKYLMSDESTSEITVLQENKAVEFTEDYLTMGQIKDDVIFNYNRGEKETMEYLKDQEEVYKETDGKLYYELSWEFIEAMAQRMHNHKSGKYELYNWKKNPTPKSIENMKQAINRHHIEVMKGNYDDADEFLGHIVSYATNSMILWEQLNKR